MKQKLFTIATTAATLAFITSAPAAGSITVKGSDTMVILAQKWAEVYMGKHPDQKIQVLTPALDPFHRKIRLA